METFLTAEQDFIKRAPIASPLNRPQTLSEVDLPLGFLEDLALKTLYLSGSITVLDLSTRLHLCYEVANELFFRMRSEVHCQVTGMTGNIPNLAITSQGRQRAMELLAQRGLPVAPAAEQAPLMTGDTKPAIAVPLTSGFARTGYELDQIAAQAAESKGGQQQK